MGRNDFPNDRIIEQGILAKCKSGGKWGILGTDGKELIAPAYKEILDVNDRTGVIHVMVDKKPPGSFPNRRTADTGGRR